LTFGVDDRLDGVFHLGGITHIAAHETSSRGALGSGGELVGFVAGAHHDRGTGLEQPSGDGGTDAAGPTGHQRHLSAEIECVGERCGHRSLSFGASRAVVWMFG
jgi:hypothetical protein